MFTLHPSAPLHEKQCTFGRTRDSSIGDSRWTRIQKCTVESVFKGPLWHANCIIHTKSIKRKFQFKFIIEKTKDVSAEAQEITRRQLLYVYPVGLLISSISARADHSGMAVEGDFPEYGPGRTGSVNVMQGSPVTTKLLRPLKDSNESDELEEVLSVKLKLLRDKAYGLNVFIGLPGATDSTSVTCSEFAGAFYHGPRRVKTPEQTFQQTVFRMGIGDVLLELGISEQQSILVTLVPTGANKNAPITVEEMKIELEQVLYFDL